MTTILRIVLLFLSCLWMSSPQALWAQERQYLAIIPTFHDREHPFGTEDALQLARQRFVLFVYRDAVVVYSEASFVNTGSGTITHELALPSTGHAAGDEAPEGKISNGILGIQLWEEGIRIPPGFVHDGAQDWYTIPLRLGTHEQRTVKSLFWAQTSLADVDSIPGLDTIAIAPGERGFMLDLSHARAWKDVFESIDVIAVLREGLEAEGGSISAYPGTYNHQDSTYFWTMRNIEPTADDDISLFYSSPATQNAPSNTMATLSQFIVPRVYDRILDYVTRLDE